MSSYAKAQDLLRQGHSYLDGNGDGEACESLR
ncbi:MULTISPECIES: excalibur calcium-binding domain-containing protein [unclassified Cyanobium]|nr:MULTISPECIES: excalibur calcium-binding domain-containing protein [unclassified Cyanobium]